MECTKEKVGEVTYIQVNIVRATLSEAEEFKNLLISSIEEGSKADIPDRYEFFGIYRRDIYLTLFISQSQRKIKKIQILSGNNFSSNQYSRRDIFSITYE